MEAINVAYNLLTNCTSSIQYYWNNWYKRLLVNILKAGPIPKHLAFIMDGNRRYARKGNLATEIGHRSGGETLKNVYIFNFFIVDFYFFFNLYHIDSKMVFRTWYKRNYCICI